jgi:hypothetical protein
MCFTKIEDVKFLEKNCIFMNKLCTFFIQNYNQIFNVNDEEEVLIIIEKQNEIIQKDNFENN